MGPADIALRLGPDAMFGVMEGAMTPGDLGDKIIAGSGSAIGGAMGGLALGKLGGNSPLGLQCLIWVALLVETCLVV